ncbi:hypothetical protein [Prevotella disiens]|uniref:hypothetical protein n=1 Tax=Prevotella disiens TaxID=28130 RepID=UPI00242ACF0B|nr:hypothetical protein [Prevotella disiens]
MNRDNININSTAGDRRTYLSPCTEIIKMETTNPLAESLGIPRKDEDTDEANGKQWQGDFDSWDEEDGNYEKDRGSVW